MAALLAGAGEGSGRGAGQGAGRGSAQGRREAVTSNGYTALHWAVRLRHLPVVQVRPLACLEKRLQ